MCGIVGGYGLNVQSDWVSCQTRKMVHRGPDFQSDLKFSSHGHFGSARLAMTDPLPRSNQPFQSEKSILIFNGEIYNHKILRKHLEDLGIRFVTESDTEVLLKSLDIWGTSSNLKIEGMYAFAYFNFDNEILVLGRDSLGKKPMYYSIANQTVHWSSSLKSMKELQSSQPINESALSEYLNLGYTIDPTTIIGGVNAVQPGHFLKFHLKDKKLIGTTELRVPIVFNRSKLEDSFKRVLAQAVSVRVEGHDSAAISLSGGIDSTVIALLASKTNSKITAYSASWPDSDKDRYNHDSKSAKDIARNLGIEHREVEIFNASELHANLKEFVVAMEEPNSNPTGLSMMNLYKSIADDSHRLVLTGDGADEILGGYPRYQSLAKVPNILKLDSNFLSRRLEKERTSLNLRFLQLLVSQTSNRNLHNWFHWHWNFTPDELRNLSPKMYAEADSSSLRNKLQTYQPDLNQKSVALNMELDRDIWLAMESNRKLDRISMHYSIEARSPFQDENVINSALSYMEKSGYGVLGKKMLQDSFPELKKIGVRQDKAGFISPVGHWLRGNPTLVRDSLEFLGGALPLNVSYLKELSNAPHLGEYRNLMKLWSLVVLSYWIQENL